MPIRNKVSLPNPILVKGNYHHLGLDEEVGRWLRDGGLPVRRPMSCCALSLTQGQPLNSDIHLTSLYWARRGRWTKYTSVILASLLCNALNKGLDTGC
jgi:hypothetical protein